VRILFVNHTAAASGAELALMRLVNGLRSTHRVAVACPAKGPLTELLDEAALERISLPAFEASLRLDAVQTPLNMLRLSAGGVTLARAARRFRADVIHANTPRAGLIGSVARRFGAPPLVVRAHEHIPPTLVGRPVRAVLAQSASAILPVSRDIASRFNEGLERPLAAHVYNSFDRARFDPARVTPAGIRESLGIGPEAALLGQIAQITPWKAQDTSIRALAELRRDGVDAHLLLVGDVAFSGRGVRYDNAAYLSGLHELVAELGLTGYVHFLGSRPDVPGILRELDLSLLPSWDEPFANVMLESMSMMTPLLVTDIGGGPELVEDGVSGRLLAPRQPGAWAAAIRELLGDRAALERMGRRARQATMNFDDEGHIRAMLNVYELVEGQASPDAAAVAAALAEDKEESRSGGGRFTRADLHLAAPTKSPIG
jgi:glycosyltransferase involved in cell wall biosynthesis